MRLLLPILLAIATPVFACCPVDPDSLLAESGDEKLLDLIAGRIERETPEFWQAQAMHESPVDRASAEAGVGNYVAALRQLEPVVSNTTIEALRTRCALALWWQGGSEEYPAADCLKMAKQASTQLPEAALFAHIIRWAEKGERADASSFLPDFFDLRYSTNKSAATDTGELKRLKLEGAEAFLLALIREDAVWENFDVFYAMSMIYVCSGRQNLAHYTRRRAWELHESGKHSRVPGAPQIADIRPLTVFRQTIGGVLTAVKVMSDENRGIIDTQYEARRAYAIEWLRARQDFAKQQLGAGRSATDTTFWTTFVPPPASIPPLKAAATVPDETPMKTPGTAAEDKPAAETGKPSRAKMWITLSVLLVILILGGLAKVRISRRTAREEANT
jgi:hypothetical protein